MERDVAAGWIDFAASPGVRPHRGVQRWTIPLEADFNGRGLVAKRVLDVVLAGTGLLLAMPLIAAIALAIWLEDGRPIFYMQERVGRYGRPFRIWKFRSMIKDAERAGTPQRALKNDSRVTRVGRLLRPSAMDELPQLLSILKGDMSFVGPRAYREFFVNQFRQEAPGYDLCLLVRPGLTGLAQVFGNKTPTARQKLRFDLLYVRHRSFWLDVKLILLSFAITFRGRWEIRKEARRARGTRCEDA